MEKTITIDGKQVRFKSTGATPLRYQTQFGRSFFRDLMGLYEGGSKKKVDANDWSKINFEMFYYIAWTLAKTADPSIPEPMEWLDSFDEFPIGEIATELQEMLTQTLQSKKN